MTYRAAVQLCLIAVAFLIASSLASCATPQETTAVVTAVGAGMAALMAELKPLIPPETLAKLQTTAASVDNTVDGLKLALGAISDAIGQMRAATSTELATNAANLQNALVTIASMPNREELYITSGAAGVAGTAASRVLSTMKDHKTGRRGQPAS